MKEDYEMYNYYIRKSHVNKSTYNMKEELIWSNICVQDPWQIHLLILYSYIYLYI